jgi:hypothetical protein
MRSSAFQRIAHGELTVDVAPSDLVGVVSS